MILELQFELRHTYPDPDIVAFLSVYEAETTLFLSDFYMSSDSLQVLLKHHGLDRVVKQGFSSCDVGLNKRSGNLFRYVHQQLGITSKDHLHIGDNLHSDVDMPKSLGIRAIHFLPEKEHKKRQERESFFHDRYALFQCLTDHTYKEAVAEIKRLELNVKAKNAYLLGVRAAPLFIGFMLNISERTLLDGIKQLYFFTREGEFFLQVWRNLFPDNCFAGQDLPEANLLEVSRIATFCPSLREVTTDELMRLWNLYSTQSISALFKTLGLHSKHFLNYAKN